MAKEPDQTKWVGIRPTDPSEDIPTTTRKLAPAIGDLQAVREDLSKHITIAAQDCTVEKTLDSAVVPAGQIWVITHLAILNETSMCDMSILYKVSDDRREVKSFYSYEPNITATLKCFLVLEPAGYIRFVWRLGGGADNITGLFHGYIIGVY